MEELQNMDDEDMDDEFFEDYGIEGKVLVIEKFPRKNITHYSIIK